MTLFLVLITIAFGISLVLILTTPDFPKAEKLIKRIAIYSLIGTLICICLLFFDLRLKGTYTTSIIGLTFVLSTILLFGLAKSNRTKMLSGLFAVPLCGLGIMSFVFEMALFPIYIMTLPFQQPMAKSEIDKNHNVEVRVGGFFACGESLVITKSKFGILDKQKYVGNNSCVTGINKIETLEFDKNKTEFLIYHDGKTEFENPYKYQPVIKYVCQHRR